MMQLRRDDPGSTASIAYQVCTRGAMEERYSWKARAFAEDVNRFMCDSWPPRSYSCSFCEREFRSAQALGGHMNVHRRDRARLCQSPPSDPSPTCAAQPTTISPVDYTSRLCLLYPIPAATSSLRPPPSLICPLISASPSLVSTPFSCPPDSPLSSTSLSHLTPGLPPACSLPTHLKPPFSAFMQYLSSPLPSLDSQCATFCTQSLNLARLSDSPNCVPQSIFHHDRERSREKSGIEAFNGYYAISQKGQKTLNMTGLSQAYAFSDDVSVADSVDLELRLGQKP